MYQLSKQERTHPARVPSVEDMPEQPQATTPDRNSTGDRAFVGAASLPCRRPEKVQASRHHGAIRATLVGFAERLGVSRLPAHRSR
jgi:hypothetical protein